MPTRPGFDLVSLRKETKARLERLKGGGSFDQVIRSALDAAEAPVRTAGGPSRDPQEQVALAQLAARRWQAAVARGQVVELGPRMFSYRLDGPEGGVDVAWSGRRGFAP